MKTYLFFFTSLIILGLTACQPNETNSDLTGNNWDKIATNFRSESDIVVQQGTEHYMGNFNHRAFLDDIFDAIIEGNIIAYDFMDNPMSIEDVTYMLSHIDTAEIEDFETGKIDTVLIEESLNPDDVVKVFTNEDWYFDKDNFTIEKKVVSITFTTLKLDFSGDPIGYDILFKIYFNGRDESL